MIIPAEDFELLRRCGYEPQINSEVVQSKFGDYMVQWRGPAALVRELGEQNAILLDSVARLMGRRAAYELWCLWRDTGRVGELPANFLPYA